VLIALIAVSVVSEATSTWKSSCEADHTDTYTNNFKSAYTFLHFAWVIDDAKCIMVTHVCVCPRPYAHTCTDPDVTWGSGRGCPLVVHYWADLQSVHGLRWYGNITWTLATSLRPSRDMTTLCERSTGCARCWPVTGGWRQVFSKSRAVYGKRARLAGR